MANAVRFRMNDVPRQNGERARLKVVTGPDYGSTFVLFGSKVSIGRGDDNDVVITDLKASRRHAEFYVDQAGWAVRDIGSANGIIFNGKGTRQAQVKTRDTITLGETTLEFLSAESGTSLLQSPPRSLDQIKTDQLVLAQQQQKVRALGAPAKFPMGQPIQSNLPKDSKRLITIVAAAGVVLYMFFWDDKPAQKRPVAKKAEGQAENQVRDLASALNQGQNVQFGKTAEVFFKIGFREYKAGNFLRAKTQFETVLQISPGHQLARMYLENCKKSIDDEVKKHLDLGLKNQMAGKLKSSRSHYQAIMRLLFHDPSNPNYVEAKEQLKKLDDESKGQNG